MDLNLGDVDLSGISGKIYYSYDNAVTAITSLVNVFILLIVLVALAAFVVWMFGMIHPKSKRYRELLSDMYVAGKVKQIAKKDDIDLVKELKDYTSFIKKTNLNLKEISKVVEEELNEKIVEDFEKNKEINKK